jgi:hypothetical protein
MLEDFMTADLVLGNHEIRENLPLSEAAERIGNPIASVAGDAYTAAGQKDYLSVSSKISEGGLSDLPISVSSTAARLHSLSARRAMHQLVIPRQAMHRQAIPRLAMQQQQYLAARLIEIFYRTR